MQFLDVSVKVVKVDIAERGGWRAEGEVHGPLKSICRSGANPEKVFHIR